MRADPHFQRFVEQRRRLNEKLDSSRVEVDQWIEVHQENEATLVEIAHLEGLLQERRDLLSALAALDDSFVGHLLEIRQSSGSSSIG